MTLSTVHLKRALWVLQTLRLNPDTLSGKESLAYGWLNEPQKFGNITGGDISIRSLAVSHGDRKKEPDGFLWVGITWLPIELDFKSFLFLFLFLLVVIGDKAKDWFVDWKTEHFFKQREFLFLCLLPSARKVFRKVWSPVSSVLLNIVFGSPV